MERLDNIIGRTGFRRLSQEHRAPQGQQRPQRPPQGSSQGVSQGNAQRTPQRPTQQPTNQQHNPATRRQLPEQTARLGRKESYGTQRQRLYDIKARYPQGSGPKEDPHTDDQAPYGYNTPDRRSSQAYSQTRSRGQTYPQRQTQAYTRQGQVSPLQPQRTYPQSEVTRPEYHMPRPFNDYDDSGPGLPADVADEWQEDDDFSGMRTGDWEDEEGEDEGYVYFPGMVQRSPKTTYPSMVRETALEIEPPTRPPHLSYTPNQTRDLYAQRQQPEQRSQQSLPPAPYDEYAQEHTHEYPQDYAQGARRPQRITQPLNPRVVSAMGRGRELVTRTQNMPGMQKQIRPPVQRKPALLPAATVVALPQKRNPCQKCNGAGFLRINVPFGHPNFGKPVACQCKENERKEKRRLQLRALSNLDAFHNQRFSSFDPRTPGVAEAYQAAHSYAQSPDGWLLLVGPNGSGKTHLAAAIANQALDDGAVVLFMVVPDLLDHLRAAFAPDAEEEYDQLFAKMREAELLILDDMGTQQCSAWANEKLFQLLNYRYNMRMPTIITANHKGMQAADERIRSRLTDASLVKQVLFDRARDHRPYNTRRN